MRPPRLTINPSEGAARYHAMSRAGNGEFYFRKDADKESFCRMLWQVADFSGLHVLTFVVMSHHFHVELHVPRLGPVSDEVLRRRYAVLHPTPTRDKRAGIEALRGMLAQNGPEAVAWRGRQLRLMGDLSQSFDCTQDPALVERPHATATA